MMRTAWVKRVGRILYFVILLQFISQSIAVAHPSYINYIDSSANFVVTPTKLTLDYFVHYSEQMSFPLITEMNPDPQGVISDEAKLLEASTLCANFVGNLRTSIDGVQSDYKTKFSSLELLPSSAGFNSIILHCNFLTSMEIHTSKFFVFSDLNLYEGSPGLHELTFQSEDGISSDSTFPTSSETALLTDYSKVKLGINILSAAIHLRFLEVVPTPKITNGPNSPSKTVVITPGSTLPTNLKSSFVPRQKSAVGITEKLSNRLIHTRHLNGWVIFLGLLLALFLGAFHSLAPGHGKSIMVAVSLSRSGRRKDVMKMALIMGGTHTVGVLILGAIVMNGFAHSTYSALRYLSFLSGVIIACTGMWIVWKRRKESLQHRLNREHDHEHRHGFDKVGYGTNSSKHIAFMGIFGGIVPTPSALTIILGTASLGTAWYGVLLVVTYGIGMSLVLLFAGLSMMKGYKLLERSVNKGTFFGMVFDYAPITSGLFQVAAGLFLIVISRVLITA